MKNFLLFAGHHYYPAGGWDDFIDSFDSLEEAKAAGLSDRGDWYHVIDLSQGGKVCEG
jgi:hypothetical protein